MRGRAVVCRTVLGLGLFALIAPGSASAMKHKLRLRTAAGVLAPGDEVTLSSSNLRFDDSGGLVLQCAQATLTGTITSNEAATVTMSLAEGSFRSEPHPGCSVSPQPIFFEFLPLSPGLLPWTVSLSSRTFQIAGSEGVELDFEPAAVCRYQGKRLRGSFLVTEPLLLTMPSPLQRLKLAMGAPCFSHGQPNANTADASAVWEVTSEGEEVRAEETNV